MTVFKNGVLHPHREIPLPKRQGIKGTITWDVKKKVFDDEPSNEEIIRYIEGEPNKRFKDIDYSGPEPTNIYFVIVERIERRYLIFEQTSYQYGVGRYTA